MPRFIPQKNKRLLYDNAGFTLLEIIAVIVILSILGVVALPKYFDLQDQAKDKAMGAGISEAMGRVNGYFAEQVLSGVNPDEINYEAALSGGEMGDFELTVEEGNYVIGGDGNYSSDINVNDDSENRGSSILLTIKGKADTPIKDMTRQKVIPRPGL